MKVHFDDRGVLCVDAEDNTEMMALRLWVGGGDIPQITDDAHLRVTTQCERGE